MSLGAPVLTPDQIEYLRSLVHGILQENKRVIDDVLSDLVEVESTNILGLYNLVVEQWQKKQQTIDNLCHFSLTMMATVHLLWQQKDHHQEELARNRSALEELQRENDELKALREQQRIAPQQKQAENPLPSTIQIAKQGQLIKCQSCIHFRQQILLDPLTNQQCSSLPADDQKSNRDKLPEPQKVSQVQSLLQEKRQLEKELQQAIEQSQLTKMELQLAELAIKDALAYKASYLSLIHNSTSRISEKSRSLENPDYLNGQIECQSHINDSFTNQARCLFSEHPQQMQPNPTYPILSDKKANGIKSSQQAYGIKNALNAFKKKASKGLADDYEQQNSKSANLEDDSCSNDEFQQYRPESQMIEVRRTTDLISRFKIKKSRIQDRQETQQSLSSDNSLFRPKTTIHPYHTQKHSTPSSSSQSSISKFYNFLTSKVVRDRIKHH